MSKNNKLTDVEKFKLVSFLKNNETHVAALKVSEILTFIKKHLKEEPFQKFSSLTLTNYLKKFEIKYKKRKKGEKREKILRTSSTRTLARLKTLEHDNYCLAHALRELYSELDIKPRSSVENIITKYKKE